MKLIPDPEKISVVIEKIRQLKKRIGFVPTMGALHSGHFSLINRARKENDIVVVSIFVNPTQFSKGEDFKEYPRRFKKDIGFCRRLGVDFVFLPDRNNMYPEGYSTFINVDNLSDCLCGVSRPGHFRGVATVVAKLLNIVHPDTLYLGQKDAQQAIIISRMVKDLNFPVKVKVLPTVRQGDGLALSSRNAYLNKQERSVALVLSKALRLAETLISNGQRNCGRIISRMKQLIERNKQAKIDYIAIVDPEQLKELKKIAPGCLIALAVKIGKVRLIDNTVIGCA
ncbi:MAG: pantoate--beta-alanine ligase [Candidatus Omnitrophica bacterium]|jgi:pantoate--beta-alanine ligase|nr:pantoate--beta-alanine ligase [Candidatus Omnitrophota bacterium]